MVNSMAIEKGKTHSRASKPRYKWPWFVLGAVLLAVLLAFLWMSKEVERMRRIHDANSPPSETNRAEPAANPK